MKKIILDVPPKNLSNVALAFWDKYMRGKEVREATPEEMDKFEARWQEWVEKDMDRLGM